MAKSEQKTAVYSFLKHEGDGRSSFSQDLHRFPARRGLCHIYLFENYPILLSVKGTWSGWFLFLFSVSTRSVANGGQAGEAPTQDEGLKYGLYHINWQTATPCCRRDPRVKEEDEEARGKRDTQGSLLPALTKQRRIAE